ncbi:MAG: ATP-binding protein [Candidatus Methanogaster sp.]|uniref:ATP-binding protein n=1 Tax=Candidatus Methanogaster sp. TaxID=3386292 RepID=A0AC61KZW8_9EURY|nr:MAG: ATP-binding protein [ANME-2 cluster archaeon]
MKRIEFHDREKETEEIRDILNSEPSLITFVYGPINSGKTTLITHLVDQLPEDYKVFYINLRGRFIRNYDDFIKVLFDVEHVARYERIKEFLKPMAAVLPESYNGIPISKDTFLNLFKEKEIEDAFVYIETVLRAFYESGHVPVLIIDELQVIGDMKIDGYLIYKLFNLFVRLTKELHLAHVFVVTSDSLFIEQVYSEAMLSGRCEYLLVDDFDEVATTAFMKEHGATDDETIITWEYCGGKPMCLLKLIRADEKEMVAKKMLATRVNQLKDLLDYLDYTQPRMVIGEDEYMVEKEDIVGILARLASLECIDDQGLDRPAKHYLIKNNILFLDPDVGIIKPQSRLNLLAIRTVLGGMQN